LFFAFGQGLIYSAIFLSAAVLHEISHLFFLTRFEARIKKVSVYPFGIDIRADTSRLSYKKEIICTLAGSAANLFFALFGAVLLCRFQHEYLLFFVMCNIFLGSINLIPLSFFDGGKALRLMLYDRLDIDRAFYVYRFLDMFSALLFLAFSFFVMFFSDFNFSVCTVILYASVSTLALGRTEVQ
jgi:Zn-dependent protease